MGIEIVNVNILNY